MTRIYPSNLNLSYNNLQPLTFGGTDMQTHLEIPADTNTS